MTSCTGWLPPEIDGNGKTIRLMSQLKPGKMNLSLEARKAPAAYSVKHGAAIVTEKPPQDELPAEASPDSVSASESAPDSISEVKAAERKAADIRSEADGYAEGFKKGESEGFVKGEKGGHDAGFDTGSKAGKQQAEANFTAEVAGQRSAIESLQKAFVQPPDYDKNLQQGLVDLVTELTKVVVSHEIKTRPEFIQNLVEQALSALPHGTEIPRVFANPADIEFLQSMSSHDVELVPDTGVARGGCRVVAGQSQIEAGLSLRIREALTASCRGEVIPDFKDIDMLKIESNIEVEPGHHAEE